MTLIERDLLIIGAGPVGLYAAYYAGFRGLSTVLVDSLPETGGQVTAMYPEKPIYDIAGFPAVKGSDLVAGLMEQLARFAPAFLLGERAQTLERGEDGGMCGACEPVCSVTAISQDRRVPADQAGFVADNARFFTQPLPGRNQPLGMAGGANGLGPLGVDTDLVASYEVA